MARSRQVKALTLSLAHHNINCSAVLLACVAVTPPSLSFSIVRGPATQLAPPPANHTCHRNINDPHYVAWPYGTALGVCARARMLRRPESRLHWRRGQALGHLPQNLTAVVTLSEEIWPWSRGGANLMDSLHLLQNVIPDVPFCPARAGEWAEPNNCTVRLVRGHWEPLRVQVMVTFSPFKY